MTPPLEEDLSRLRTTTQGLTQEEAVRRLRRQTESRRPGQEQGRTRGTLALLFSQFTSPVTLLLLAATALSWGVGDTADAPILLLIVMVSGLLGFWQEHSAADAVQKLLALVQVKTTVLRDDRPTAVALDAVVPGDVVLLRAGAVVPGDCRLIAARDLSVDEAVLTGETFPVEKTPDAAGMPSSPDGRRCLVFLGTHVVSGAGAAVVLRTGADTDFGKISATLKERAPETEFDRGVRRFGYLLLEITLLLTLFIFAANVFLKRPVLDSFLFALALAVGLTPQLLPAVIAVNLARGANRMAAARVIVRRLASLEDFGSMDVLCSDKTGTLTVGTARLQSTLDPAGQPSATVGLYARLNATLQTGYPNPLDNAIRDADGPALTGYAKRDEVPYDFSRKRLSLAVSSGDAGSRLLITKGAVPAILAVCRDADSGSGATADLANVRADIEAQFADLCGQGLRVLGLAYRELDDAEPVTKDTERDMVFAGFVVLEDPVRADAPSVIARLRSLGVSLKVITGDNRLAAAQMCREAGLDAATILTGDDLRGISDAALPRQAAQTTVFAEIEPNQKQRIVLALRKAGHVVGYLGDGINDAPALHAADVGISVAGAADVACEAADIVLLEKDLSVLEEGVRAGRITFANTLKYVFMAASANFGNMLSMAVASLFLPFLPLLPRQILLTNLLTDLLTDLPEMAIAADAVDPEMVRTPRRWDVRAIRRFMLVFGLLSSAFDGLTFLVLLYLLRADTAAFRTGWFVESVMSASLIVLVIRTRRSVLKSRPAKPLLGATVCIALSALALPYTPLGPLLGLVPLPATFLPILMGILLAYVVAAEMVKAAFFRKAQ